MEIKDKVVIITGASGGIGRAAAELLSRNGARVALVARSADKLKMLEAKLPGSFAFVADMSRERDITAMVEAVLKHYERIDVLINNAGRGMWAVAETTSLPEYRALMELNLFGPLAAMQAVIPVMRRQGGGLIINISSGVTLSNIPGLSAYSSTKYALNSISRTARAELAADNIRISLVLPTITTTDFGRNAVGSPPAGFRGGAGAPPPPRAETAEQVAEKILQAVRTEAAEVLADGLANR